MQALDPNNSPGWDTQSSGSCQSGPNTSKLPLFVKNVAAMAPQGPGQETQVTANDEVNYNL